MISEYKGIDPLDPWLAYIRWAQQTYDTQEQGEAPELQEILAECTVTFMNDARYTNSKQYLKVGTCSACITWCCKNETMLACLSCRDVPSDACSRARGQMSPASGWLIALLRLLLLLLYPWRQIPTYPPTHMHARTSVVDSLRGAMRVLFACILHILV